MKHSIPKVDVPEGKKGDWRIQRFTVSRSEAVAFNLREMIQGTRRIVEPGQYTALICGSATIMSDTPAEIKDHLDFVRESEGGEILITGLGLGMVANAMLMRPDVKRVTVVEMSPDVIALAAPHYRQKFGERIEIIEADALTWKPPPGIRYGGVWHDIWPTICADNLEQMKQLKSRFRRRSNVIGAWCEAECRRDSRGRFRRL